MKIKYVIRSVAFVITACFMLISLTVFCQANNPRDVLGMYGFYQEPESSIDVGIIGASEVYSGFYSPLAYEKYGFTSYALSTSAMPASLFVPAIKELYSKQKPQVLVIEMWSYTYNKKMQTSEDSLRKFLDNTPPSDNKTETIKKLIPEDQQKYYKYPVLKYHNFSSNLPNCSKVAIDKIKYKRRGYSIIKNYSTTTFSFSKNPDKHNSDNRAKKVSFSDEGIKYLKETLEYCKNSKIENVLFVYFPDLNTFNKENFAKSEQLITSYGYNFINLNNHKKEIGLENKDFYNICHLNINGAVKLTNYLGKYIDNNYKIEKNHSQEVKKEWDDCASYNDFIIENCRKKLKKNKEIQIYRESEFLTIK